MLRFIALLSCLAVIGIVIPSAWLDWFVQKAQPGTPNGILTNYLFRILNLMYAWAGLQCWIYSTDIRRYLVLIWILAVGSLVLTAFGIALLFLLVPPEQRIWFFWVALVDFAEAFAQAIVLVILLFRIRRTAPVAPCLGVAASEAGNTTCSSTVESGHANQSGK